MESDDQGHLDSDAMSAMFEAFNLVSGYNGILEKQKEFKDWSGNRGKLIAASDLLKAMKAPLNQPIDYGRLKQSLQHSGAWTEEMWQLFGTFLCRLIKDVLQQASELTKVYLSDWCNSFLRQQEASMSLKHQ